MVRRQRTDDRKQLHKNTHLWKRKKYRTMRADRVAGHIQSGYRDRLVINSIAA